jgi:hypothetical protein
MEELFNLPIQDIILGLTVFIALIVGIFQGAIKSLTYIVLFIAVLAIAYYAVLPPLVGWMRYNMFADFNFVLTIPVNDFTFKIYSVNDLFLFFQNFGVDSSVLQLNCQGFCEAVAFIALLICVSILVRILNLIIYHGFIKPKLRDHARYVYGQEHEDNSFLKIKYKPSLVSRLVGGLLQFFFAAFMFYIDYAIFASLTSGLYTVLYPQLIDTGSSLYTSLIDYGATAEIISTTSVIIKDIALFVDPTYEVNYVVAPIINNLSSMGINIYNLFKGGVYKVEGSEEVVSGNLYDGMKTFWNSVVTALTE